jgi:hypothetical protein
VVNTVDTPCGGGFLRAVRRNCPPFRLRSFLDHADHIVWAHDVACNTDEDALADARLGLSASAKAEVWTGTRCVG